MSGRRARVTTIQAIVAGSPIIHPVQVPILDELEEIFKASRVRKQQRRLLLQFLHATRALDTALSSFIRQAGGPRPISIGRALDYLVNPGLHGNRWPLAKATQYKSSIANPRNTYMHEAWRFPRDSREVAVLLGEIEACLAEAFALW